MLGSGLYKVGKYLSLSSTAILPHNFTLVASVDDGQINPEFWQVRDCVSSSFRTDTEHLCHEIVIFSSRQNFVRAQERKAGQPD